MQRKEKNCEEGAKESCKYFNQINIKHKLDKTENIIA